MNRNRIIAVVVIGVVLMLVIAGGVRLWRWANPPPQANQRTPITKLGYCGPEKIRPCVESFNLDQNGNMLVRLLIPIPPFPNVYLTIHREAEEYRYSCQKAKGFSTSLTCTGPELFPGEVMQFRLITVRDDRVLAEGRFAIIGLLLATPVAEVTETGTPQTGTPTQTETPFSLEILTPVVTTTPSPSYPNPSYPNQ